MDFQNDDVKKYLAEKEKVLWCEGYASGLLFWSKIGMIIWGILLCWTIVFPIGFVIAYFSMKSKKYVITNKRVLIISGLLNKSVKDIPYNKITDTQVNQPILEKLLYKSGNILLNTAGGGGYEGKIQSVANPFEVKKIIDAQLK